MSNKLRNKEVSCDLDCACCSEVAMSEAIWHLEYRMKDLFKVVLEEVFIGRLKLKDFKKTFLRITEECAENVYKEMKEAYRKNKEGDGELPRK